MQMLNSFWQNLRGFAGREPMFVRLSIALFIVWTWYNLRCVYLFDGMDFARSGAVIVMLGLLLGVKDLQMANQETVDNINRRVEEAGQAVASALKEEGISPVAKDLKVRLASLEQRFEMLFAHSQLFRVHVTKKEESSLPADAAMAAVGTLVWGFGDLYPIAEACYL